MRLLLLVLGCLFSIHTTTAQDIDITGDCKCKSQIESSEMGYNVEQIKEATSILCGTISSAVSGRKHFRTWDSKLKAHFRWQGNQEEILSIPKRL